MIYVYIHPQLQRHILLFNTNIHSTSTQTIFIQQKISIQLLYLKFPDIPNVYSTKTARPLPNSVNVRHTDTVSWDA